MLYRSSTVKPALHCQSKQKSTMKILINNVAILLLGSSLMLGGAVFAANSDLKMEQRVAQNINDDEQSSMDISNEEMTTASVKKQGIKDNKIGAFSMQDGAREGYYGDGEFSH